ncbi:hypothetical protein SteCoe_4267 [Stentor coeruleus]|uniref:Uncharacterized protein n=1 Tax=Stentor coeruleus TaxID=5963 RepID=A0A1R2CV97_9CILI|nr:hypothetical protein SteCoe_4267 [Stentor coeruleus]
MSLDFDTNQLVSLLDKAKQKLKEKKNTEFTTSDKQHTENDEEVVNSHNKEDIEISWFSLNSSNDKVSSFLSEQITEIKELFKNQEQMFEKFQESENCRAKGRDIKENEGNKGKGNFDQSPFYDPLLSSEERNHSAASTLIGCNKSEFQKNPYIKTEPIIGFAKKSSRLKFSEKIIIASHLSTLNL